MAEQKISDATRIQKIGKNSPFDLSVITAEYPQHSQLLAVTVGQLAVNSLAGLSSRVTKRQIKYSRGQCSLTYREG